MRTIQKHWEGYKNLVLPPHASDIQIEECRRAFYAGAISCLNVMDSVGDESISENAGVEIIEGLHQELESFASDLVNQPSG